jgi:hypothetical protein
MTINGNVTGNGDVIFNATSVNPNESYNLTFSEGVHASNMSLQSGLFYFNADANHSGSSLVLTGQTVVLSANTIVNTNNNILDDGSGNLTATGTIKAPECLSTNPEFDEFTLLWTGSTASQSFSSSVSAQLVCFSHLNTYSRQITDISYTSVGTPSWLFYSAPTTVYNTFTNSGSHTLYLNVSYSLAITCNPSSAISCWSYIQSSSNSNYYGYCASNLAQGEQKGFSGTFTIQLTSGSSLSLYLYTNGSCWTQPTQGNNPIIQMYLLGRS